MLMLGANIRSDSNSNGGYFKISSTRTPMLMQGRRERTETNLMHFKGDVT